MAEAHGFFNFVVFGVVAQRGTKEAQRDAEIFGWSVGVRECWGRSCLGFFVLGRKIVMV